MCPHTAPISRAGKAAASAAGRLLRAFEAELAPVVEAISPAAMGETAPRWDAAARARAAAVVERARARGLEISRGSSFSMRTSWWSAEEHRWGPPEPGSGDEGGRYSRNSSSSSSSRGGSGAAAA